MQEIHQHVVVNREYLTHLGEGRRKHPLPEDTDDGYKLQHLTHQMYLAATERANKATELFVFKDQELAAITCDHRKLFKAHQRLLGPDADGTRDKAQAKAAGRGRTLLRDAVLPPPTPPEVWSTRALAMVNDGEFLPKSWLQTGAQYLQKEASLSRSTKPWVENATWTSSDRQPPTVLEVNKHTRPATPPRHTDGVHAINWKTPSQMTSSDRPNLVGQTPRMMTDLEARMYQERSETLRRVQARDYHQRRYIQSLKKRKAPSPTNSHPQDSEASQTERGHGLTTARADVAQSKATGTDKSVSSLDHDVSRDFPSDEQVPRLVDAWKAWHFTGFPFEDTVSVTYVLLSALRTLIGALFAVRRTRANSTETPEIRVRPRISSDATYRCNPAAARGAVFTALLSRKQCYAWVYFITIMTMLVTVDASQNLTKTSTPNTCPMWEQRPPWWQQTFWYVVHHVGQIAWLVPQIAAAAPMMIYLTMTNLPVTSALTVA